MGVARADTGLEQIPLCALVRVMGRGRISDATAVAPHARHQSLNYLCQTSSLAVLYARFRIFGSTCVRIGLYLVVRVVVRREEYVCMLLLIAIYLVFFDFRFATDAASAHGVADYIPKLFCYERAATPTACRSQTATIAVSQCWQWVSPVRA